MNSTVSPNERVTGTFRRQLTLGDDVDAEKIEARHDSGVVTLSIPIREQAKPRKIQIGTMGSDRVLEGKATES